MSLKLDRLQHVYIGEGYSGCEFDC